MTFKQALEADVSLVFTNTDEFGEAVTYRFRNGTLQPVNAIVNRDPYSFADGNGNLVIASMTIVLSTSDIEASSINTGGDSVVLPLKIGAPTTVVKSVVAILNQDFGAVKIALL